MDRVKNITDGPLSVPSLDLLIAPGDAFEAEDGSSFADSGLWHVTTSRKAKSEETS